MTKLLEKNMIEGEILSPEGIEEKIEKEYRFLITLTGGGKYRVYTSTNGDLKPMKVHDTMKEATKDLGFGMAFMGGMLVDPKETVSSLLNMIKKGKE